MKRFARVLVIFFVLLIISVLVFPAFYKGKIKQAVLDAFAQNVNGELYFSDVNLSLISNFPDFTVSINDMGIVGVGLFKGDTLLSAKDASMTIDLMDVISGSDLGAKSIGLLEPSITILTLADGTANYDIAKESESVEDSSVSDSEGLTFAIESFAIEDGEFIYFDQSTQVFIQLEDINVTGDGNFTEDIFDLKTNGTLNLYDFNYGGVDYVENKEVELGATIGMDLTNSVYTFKENQINVNKFPLHADGSFSLLTDGYGMDLSFDAPGATFAQLLSLVPGIYQSSLEELQADGQVKFNGFLKGNYNDSTMPAFDFAVEVANGIFSYAEYPQKIDDFKLNMKLANPTGTVEDTHIEVNPVGFKVGNSPFEAKLVIDNLRDYQWDLETKGTLDLALVNSLYPQEGVDLAGEIEANLKSSGDYNLVQKEAYSQLPFTGEMNMRDFEYNDPEMIELSISSADLKFNNNLIALTNLIGKTKSTSFEAEGQISNYIGFALADEVLKGSFTGKADKLNLNEWMTTSDDVSSDDVEESTYEVVRIPSNVDFKSSLVVNEIQYNDLTFNNAKGTLNLVDGIASFEETGMDLLNGTVSIEGTYNSLLEKPFFRLWV